MNRTTAGGAESVCGERAGEDGLDRCDQSRRTVDIGGDGGIAPGDLCPADRLVVAEPDAWGE